MDICKVVNGIRFYYDPEEIDIEEVMPLLEEEGWDEEAYVICNDSSQGIIIY